MVLAKKMKSNNACDSIDIILYACFSDYNHCIKPYRKAETQLNTLFLKPETRNCESFGNFNRTRRMEVTRKKQKKLNSTKENACSFGYGPARSPLVTRGDSAGELCVVRHRGHVDGLLKLGGADILGRVELHCDGAILHDESVVHEVAFYSGRLQPDIQGDLVGSQVHLEDSLRRTQ